MSSLPDPLRFNVPNLSVLAPPVLRRAVAPSATASPLDAVNVDPSTSVPPVTLVAPVQELLPVRVIVLTPALVTDRGDPPASVMFPAIVSGLFAVRLGPPDGTASSVTSPCSSIGALAVPV